LPIFSLILSDCFRRFFKIHMSFKIHICSPVSHKRLGPLGATGGRLPSLWTLAAEWLFHYLMTVKWGLLRWVGTHHLWKVRKDSKVWMRSQSSLWLLRSWLPKESGSVLEDVPVIQCSVFWWEEWEHPGGRWNQLTMLAGTPSWRINKQRKRLKQYWLLDDFRGSSLYCLFVLQNILLKGYSQETSK
jgi:hypothetical protein